MNIKNKCITDAQFDKIINVLEYGTENIKPNKEMALILTLTGNCALRIGDALQLKLNSFIKEAEFYKFNIKEQKTGKQRTFIIQNPVYEMIRKYAKENEINDDELLFHYSVRTIQWKLQKIREELGEEYKNVSTHAFRKCAGMRIYKESGNDIELTRKFMNHSSVNITQRYLGVDDDDVNEIVKRTYHMPRKEKYEQRR